MRKLPVPMPPPAEMLHRRQGEIRRHRKRMKLFRCLCLTAVVTMIVFSQFLLVQRNEGLGMLPTVKNGDLALAWRMTGEWSKEDLVVFCLEGKLQLGRIAAVARDEVRRHDSGSLLVNGSVCDGQTLYPTYARQNGEFPLLVPEGTVYILGDHRTQSRDSRDFGCVPLENLMGKVIAVVRIGGV